LIKLQNLLAQGGDLFERRSLGSVFLQVNCRAALGFPPPDLSLKLFRRELNQPVFHWWPLDGFSDKVAIGTQQYRIHHFFRGQLARDQVTY
jgi:hypothetical protein